MLMFVLPAIGLASLLLGATAVVVDQPDRPAESPRRLPPVPPNTEGAYIGATGIVEPSSENRSLSPEVSGVLRALHADVGEQVEAGAAMFTLDSSLQEAAVARAQSQVEVRLAELQQLRSEIPAVRAQLDAARRGVEQAEAALADRRNQLDVAERAGGVRAIAAEQLASRRFAVDQASASLAGARAQVATAEAQQAQYQDPAHAEPGARLLSAQARVAQAQAELEEARSQLALRTVRAPFAGQVLQVNLREGEYVSAGGDPGVVVLGDTTPMHVRASIDEFDIPRFDPASAAVASPRGDGDRRTPLTFVRLEPRVVPKTNLTGRSSERVDTRVLEVLYAVPADGPPLFVGQQVDVFIRAADTGDDS